MANDIPDWAREQPKAEPVPAWASSTEAVPSWAASPSQPAQTPAAPSGDRRRAFLQETDRMLGFPVGTSERQIQVESGFNSTVVSKRGAEGLAQVMPATKANLEKRLGRKLDSFNEDDALLMHREVMRENVTKFGNMEDALRAYNGGWDPSKWGNPETTTYVEKVTGRAPVGYQPWAPVRQNIEPKTLYKDPDWVKASMLMYNLFERKPFSGSQEDAAAYGVNGIYNFNYDMVNMARIAKTVVNASDEEKRAFLYMLDTYDNTNTTAGGVARAIGTTMTDPTTYLGLGTLGIATAGKLIGRKAEIEAARLAVEKSLMEGVKESVARTGITAGIESGIQGGTASSIKQGVEVSAGRRDEISLGQVALDTGIAATGGVILGTGADMAAAKIAGLVRGARKGGEKAAAVVDEAAPSVSGVAKDAEGKAAATLEVKAAEALPDGKAAEVLPEGKPLGSTLTPSELADAAARQQKGRLPADGIVPEVPAGSPKLDVPDVANTGMRHTAVNMDEQGRVAAPIVEQLRGVETKDLPAVLEQVRTGQYSLEQFQVLARGIQDYAKEVKIELAEVTKALQKATNPDEIASLTARQAQLEARDAAILADDAIGSFSGSLLRQRQEGLPGVNGITVESIMAEKGVTKAEAQAIWADLVDKAARTAEARKVAAEWDARIAETDSLTQKAVLATQKARAIASLGENIAPGGATFIQKLNEFVISNVFSLKTVLVNLIPSGLKTLVIPGLKLVVTNPLDKVARIEAMASYSAMRSSFSGAWQAAKAGYRYEQALLTRDGTRLVEGEMAMKGKLGGGLRVLPRILNASDEFLSRINYDSFVAGRAAAEAAIKAQEKGLTGEAMNDAVDKAVKAALVTSRATTNGQELVQPIINKGVNLGLTGEELFRWVEREAMRDPQALLKGTDEEALNFVRDVLYKRKFTGDNFASKAAATYEEAMNKFPTLKLAIGQLFFRTPVRVFEEGIRLTPGLQILAPGFVQDLYGSNGALRQVRAQAEAMTSLAIAGAALSLYGQGRITGDGAYSDWKQQRTRTDGPLPEPYTIKMSDGSTWSFRNFDPLATPLKIIINGLERADRLALREAQGEFVDKSEFDKAMAYVTVGVTAVAAAIKDANLTEGINQLYKFGQNITDPEKHEDAFLKLMGDRLQTLVPNTLHKIAKDNDPTIKDPVTFWQVVEEKLARPFGYDNIKTPYSYDVLGNQRRLTDTGSLWNVFSTASVEERNKGMNPESLFVMQELDRLSRVTGATFKPPTKAQELGDLDLRTLLAADGKRTLYDVWQENYKALEPEKALYPILKEPMPDGTFKVKADRVELVQSTMKDLQDAALMQTMNQEQAVLKKWQDNILYEQKAKAGLFDSKRPY